MQNVSTASTNASNKKCQEENIEHKKSVAKPSPLDFDYFLPWLCTEWDVPETIVVARANQEIIKKNERKSSSKSSKSLKMKESGEQHLDTTKSFHKETSEKLIASKTKKASLEKLSLHGDYITLKTIYDVRGHLVEVAIINSPFLIHRKVIQAINICVPFHAFFTKLVIRGKGLSFTTLYEISKLLPHSNLTHVCLDDTRVPEGNYFVLLDHRSQLKCLSFNRCCINDTVSKEIADRIDLDRPAYSSLMVLELSSNSITDVGAQCFGDILKMNRRLLYLNLTGNKITDVGAKAILKHLMEFEISRAELIQSKTRQVTYMEKRKVVLQKCINDVVNQNRAGMASKLSFKRSDSTKIKIHSKSCVSILENRSGIDIAENMTKEIMGEFEDPFEYKNIINKDKKLFSMGNMTLCSLNLSYNYLEYPSVKMIADVLEYQCRMTKSERGTGLMRIVIDGNPIPNSCPEYKTIKFCLHKLVNGGLRMARAQKKHSLSVTKKKV